VPAALAAVAATLVPIGTDRLGLAGLHPLIRVVVVGAAASLIAGGVLWATDRPLRRLALTRLRRRSTDGSAPGQRTNPLV
jgi:hypothetical protein